MIKHLRFSVRFLTIEVTPKLQMEESDGRTV